MVWPMPTKWTHSPWTRTGDVVLQAWLRLLPGEHHRMFVLTLIIGATCGFAAVLFHLALRAAEALLIERALGASNYNWIGWTLACTTGGGLVCGSLLEYGAPGARGSGIPQVKTAYAIKSGRIRLRDSVSKFGIAVVQIGTGSSLGREGPTVHICAGIASTLGRLFALSPRSARRLLPVGSSAGIAAAFNAPIAAVTFTIEEIVGDLDQTVLSGVVVASALAAVIEHSVLGGHPVFDVPQSYGLGHPSSLLIYALLGLAAAFLGNGFNALLLFVRERFGRLAIPGWLKPGIGGLMTGLLAVLALLSVGARGITGGGYTGLAAALTGSLTLQVMLVSCALKVLATAFSYGSGGAGGIFAPTLFIGGMLGGCFGILDRELLNHQDAELGAFALVGMGALLAAVVRTPITSVLIIFEMTRSYGLVLPLMIANTTAYVLARRRQPLGIYEALLAQNGVHLPHRHRSGDALSAFRVSEAMTTELVTLRSAQTIAAALQQIEGLPHTAYPVLDESGKLQGLVTESRLRRRHAEGRGDALVATAARQEEYLIDHGSLVEAVSRMHTLSARQMLVVDMDKRDHLVGVLALSDVVRAHARAASLESLDGDDIGDSERRNAVAWTRRDTAITDEAAPPAPARTDSDVEV
jgi:chloride channel protein, CIC family